jgi:hypothetical protein
MRHCDAAKHTNKTGNDVIVIVENVASGPSEEEGGKRDCMNWEREEVQTRLQEQDWRNTPTE